MYHYLRYAPCKEGRLAAWAERPPHSLRRLQCKPLLHSVPNPLGVGGLAVSTVHVCAQTGMIVAQVLPVVPSLLISSHLRGR